MPQSDVEDDSDDEIEVQKQRDLSVLEKHVAMLEEHFDTVQIICTRQHDKGTFQSDLGGGNWYARYGSTREWVMRQEEMERDRCRNKGE